MEQVSSAVGETTVETVPQPAVPAVEPETVATEPAAADAQPATAAETVEKPADNVEAPQTEVKNEEIDPAVTAAESEAAQTEAAVSPPAESEAAQTEAAVSPPAEQEATQAEAPAAPAAAASAEPSEPAAESATTTTQENEKEENSQPAGEEQNTLPTPTPIDYSKMEPAPKPEPEPDMNNLPEVPMPKHQSNYALRVIKIIKRMKDAVPFLQPVDTVKLNIPLYYNFIKRPMDLSTIEKKLNVNAYAEIEQFIQDFNLIVDNCARFNGAESAIAKMGRNIQASFEKHMLNLPPKVLPVNPTNSKANGIGSANDLPIIRRDSTNGGRPKREIHPPKPKDMPYDTRPRKKKYVPELRFSQQVLKELTSKKYESFNYPFLEPVDPVALNCPTYFEYVKEPMDLSTVQNKLNNNQYENADEFHRDIKLMFHNCYAFNPEGTAVNIMGHKLEAVFDKRWLDKPITPSTPVQNSDEEFDSDFDSDVDDVDESQITNPAIQFLEQQLETMKSQLEKLKKEELAKLRKERSLQKRKRKHTHSSNSRKKKHHSGQRSENSIVVTYDMKKELSERINELPEKKLNQVLTIISESLNINNENSDEIELDMDQLDNSTLLKLYNFVVKKSNSSSVNSSLSNGSNLNSSSKKMKKPRNMTEAEQSQQIETIRKKLELLENGNQPQSTYNGFSSDDDSQSSESEEE